MINTVAQYKVLRDFEAHNETGTDLAVKNGTPIYAFCDGYLHSVKSGGQLGYYADLTVDRKKVVTFAHLSKLLGTGPVKEGQLIGYSGGVKGAPGSGISSGPHLHVHYTVNGRRVDYLELFPNNIIGSGTETKIEDEDMAKNSGFIYKDNKNVTTVLIVNTDSGFNTKYNGVDDTNYHNQIAGAFGTGNFANITASHADAIVRDCEAVKKRT